jgi:hypothetical protein
MMKGWNGVVVLGLILAASCWLGTWCPFSRKAERTQGEQ